MFTVVFVFMTHSVLPIIYLMPRHNWEGNNQCPYYRCEKRLTFRMPFAEIHFGEKWRLPMCETAHICSLNYHVIKGMVSVLDMFLSATDHDCVRCSVRSQQ